MYYCSSESTRQRVKIYVILKAIHINIKCQVCHCYTLMRIKHLLIDSLVCWTSPNCLSEGVNATEREVYWDVSLCIKHATGFMLYIGPQTTMRTWNVLKYSSYTSKTNLENIYLDHQWVCYWLNTILFHEKNQFIAGNNLTRYTKNLKI